MTNSATTATATKGLTVVTPESVKLTEDQVTTLRQALNVDRHEHGLAMATMWRNIGEVINRIKIGKKDGTFDGKIEDLVDGFFNCKIGEDDRSYSVKMAKDDGILDWYEKTKCTKYNPRTIWTAYKPKKKAEPKEDGEETGEETGGNDEELTQKKYLDVAQALTQAMKYYEKATLDGNLTPNEMILINKELKAFTDRVKEDAKLAIKAETVATHTAKKKAA